LFLLRYLGVPWCRNANAKVLKWISLWFKMWESFLLCPTATTSKIVSLSPSLGAWRYFDVPLYLGLIRAVLGLCLPGLAPGSYLGIESKPHLNPHDCLRDRAYILKRRFNNLNYVSERCHLLTEFANDHRFEIKWLR
jgi:hypothetical protein